MGNRPANLTALITKSILNANRSALNQKRIPLKNVLKTRNAFKNVISNVANIGKVNRNNFVINFHLIISKDQYYCFEISIFKVGKLTEKIKTTIADYIARSSLANPYGYKDELWKWSYLINVPKNTRKKHKFPSSTTKSRIVRNENKPTHYNNEQNTRLENDVPTWDIAYKDLLPFYVKAYQERFIEWKNEEDRDCRDEEGNPKVFLRRISWLYVNECMYILIILCFMK